VQEESSDAFRKGAQRGMARASNAERAGLDVDLTQHRNGKWQIVLKDSQGSVVYDKIYGTEWTAKDKARRWVREHYETDTQETEPEPVPVRSKQKGSSLGPTPSNLVTVMRARADDNEEKAITLRAQAGHLETEAKRLREAADTLGGPDGQS
jgi:hypothetical protein